MATAPESERATPEVAPPDPVFARAQWVPPRLVEWVKQADEIMVEHGAVHGRNAYPTRHQARWRARKLIDVMQRLKMHERWELKERTSKTAAGWVWAVEYKGKRDDD